MERADITGPADAGPDLADGAADAADESADPAPDSVDEPRLAGGVDEASSTPDADALAERDRALLDFEKRWWRQPGAKEQAIRDQFDLPPTRYYQLLNGLLDRPAALAYDPVLVNRLRRLRTGRGPTRR
ncbi:DUF3263 domain-containing protein [Planosporangium sp. 12N6]|uniref:DUF3263 domain-containing protein n=1 Tax=Planosporangium spinosum TaxID=3402278 RepID=UPI003CEC0D91